jgi:hypothetical protein|tara:strand:+ start:771 stop:1082 length:312 start_codon:yes stop_codon:yes gene_type:complete
MSTLIEAILAINPTAEVSVSDENWDTIIWHSGTPIAKNEILKKQNELKINYENNLYQRKRVLEYKALKEQLDLLYHDMTAGTLDNTGKWHKHIKSVKDKYPKG